MEVVMMEVQDQILIITINRPQALNALNSEVMLSLQRIFTEIHESNSQKIQGVIITGAGPKAFVAGADITEFSGLNAAQGSALAQRGQDIFRMIEQCPVPVIAAVNGFALGGGCELAMSCHMRVASDKAKFGQPEVNLGLIPGYGGTQRLIQLIGKGKAIEYLCTASMMHADEALRLGLVNYVVPAGEEITKAKELLSLIQKKAPIAITGVLKCADAYFSKDTDGYRVEVEEFGACCTTQDFKEGVSAFLEKRDAQFQNK